MSQIVPPGIGQTYSPPSVRQYSVFLENKVGRLLDLVRMFDGLPNLHLCSLAVVESSDFAVIRLITSNSWAAQDLLRKHGLSFSTMRRSVELGPEHSIASMCLCLLGAELNIRFAYPLLRSTGNSATIALAVDDHVLVGQILRRKNFRLLGEEDLAGMID